MINIFNRKKARELKEFKEAISGYFDDWERSEYTLEKDGYVLWIANGISHFRDHKPECYKTFLGCFSKKERKIIADEVFVLSKKNKIKERELILKSILNKKNESE